MQTSSILGSFRLNNEIKNNVFVKTCFGKQYALCGPHKACIHFFGAGGSVLESEVAHITARLRSKELWEN